MQRVIFTHEERNPLNQAIVFCLLKVLKLTYGKTKSHKFSGGDTPGPPLQGRGTGREGKEGEGGDGREGDFSRRGPPNF